MFFFALGTIPLMLGFGSIVAGLGKHFTKQVLKCGAILVVPIGMIQIQTWKKMESNMSPAHWNLVIIQISLLKQEPLSNGLFTLKKAVLTAATIRFC